MASNMQYETVQAVGDLRWLDQFRISIKLITDFLGAVQFSRSDDGAWIMPNIVYSLLNVLNAA
jgi:hypothetical protein